MKDFKPRLIFWETTRTCNLPCPHCRASSIYGFSEGDLTTEESKKLIDDVVSFADPILVLSGGEPLIRSDIYEISDYGTKRGLRVVLASNATLIDNNSAKNIKASGIKRIAVSLYGGNKEMHDGFIGKKGVFEKSIRGIKSASNEGIPIQINTTITKRNVNDLNEIVNLSISLAAEALHVFLLVPVGRGKEIEGDEILPHEYEAVLNRLYELNKEFEIELKATCAPHYHRVMRQRDKEEKRRIKTSRHGFGAITKGCLAGSGVCFISHKGEVFPCGYLPITAGEIRKNPFSEIWNNSSLFLNLRDENKLKGKCGECEYKKVCGGCRARAYARYGDYLEEEPYCIYQPEKMRLDKHRNI